MAVNLTKPRKTTEVDLNIDLPPEERRKHEEKKTKKEKDLLQAERTYRAGIESVRDLIAPAAMQISQDRKTWKYQAPH